MANDQIHAQWNAPEFKHYPKNSGWFVTFWAVAIMILIYEIFQKDIFGSICIAIIAGLSVFLLKQEPEEVEIKITDKGVHINDLGIPYKQIKHFWIISDENHKVLNLITNNRLNSFLTIELLDQDPDDLRGILQNYIVEHESIHPTVVQQLSHFLKL